MTEILDAYELFEQAKRNEKLSSRTLKRYRWHVTGFAASLPADRQEDMTKIKKADVSRWINAQQKRGLVRSSIELYYRTLVTFFDWCVGSRQIDLFFSPLAKPTVHVEITPMTKTIEMFLAAKSAEGRAKSTLYEYRYYLGLFSEHCDKPIAGVEPADIPAWINDEREKNPDLVDKSIHARWAAIRGFFTWCVENGLLEKNPVAMKPPKRRKKDARVADYASVLKLMDFEAADWTDKRDKAILHLLLDTGMRIGEVAMLQLTDVSLGKRQAHIGTSKDAEDRTVPFTQACADTIQAYLDSRPRCKSSQLFLGRRGRKILGGLTTWGAQRMVRRRCETLGIGHINPHSIRHLWATRSLNAGLRVEVVSKILGHSTVDFTLRMYARLQMGTIQQEYDQHWETKV